MELFDVYPLNDIIVDRAAGSFIWDDSGNRYLDLYGGHAVISIGHAHPHWTKRIEDQLRKIAFYSNSVKIPLQHELSTLLGRMAGRPDYKLFLCNSGAEANENALKLASFHTGRKKIISFSGAFHGRTSLAVAITDNAAIQAPVNETANVIMLPFNDAHALQTAMEQYGSEVAAVIIEPIQGVGGITMADDSFLSEIRTLCDAHGAVFIADEVQCGFGRTGKFFAADHAGVDADIYTMAKGMGNGFPVAGIAIHPRFEARHSMLGTTFGGNHLACAAAIAVLEVMEAENLMSNAADAGSFLVDRLSALPGIGQVRGKGLMIGFNPSEELKSLRSQLLWKHRIFTGEARPNVVRLLPSLAIGQKELSHFIDTVEEEIAVNKN